MRIRNKKKTDIVLTFVMPLSDMNQLIIAHVLHEFIQVVHLQNNINGFVLVYIGSKAGKTGFVKVRPRSKLPWWSGN